jgi:formylglycine-generating enzyme required for sulfatase activity
MAADSGVTLRAADTIAPQPGHLTLRRKTGAQSYQLYRGIPSVMTLQELRSFPLGKLDPQVALKVRFYRKADQPKFQDIQDIYFGIGEVLASGLDRIFYRDAGGALVELGSRPVGGLALDMGSYGKVLRSGLQPGWGSEVVAMPGRMPIVVGFPVEMGQLTELTLSLPARPELDTSSVRETRYGWQPNQGEDAMLLVRDSLDAELSLARKGMERAAESYDALLPPVVSPPRNGIASSDTLSYRRYLSLHDSIRLEDFTRWSAPLMRRLSYLDSRRAEVAKAVEKIESQVRTVQVVPLAWRAKAEDSLNGVWQLKARVEALNGQIEGIWKVQLALRPALADSLVKVLASNRDTSAVKVTLSYQNRAARITRPEGLQKRYYRIAEMKLTYLGQSIPLAGEFTLPDYVRNFPEVAEWLRRSELDAEQVRQAELARQQQAVHDQQVLRANKLRIALELLRGKVVDLPEGRFAYQGRMVKLSPFGIQTTEVTQAHYERLMRKNPSVFKDSLKPVQNVDWDAARSFCQDIGGDLPTQAQWEYAARAGTTDYFYWGPKRGPAVQGYAVFEENSLTLSRNSTNFGPWHVGQLRPNAWGLYDMAGNVAEWTSEFHSIWGTVKRTLMAEDLDPQGPKGNLLNHFRVFKGGSWRSEKPELEHAKSDWEDPRYRGDDMGVRCVFPARQFFDLTEIEKMLRKYRGDTAIVLPPNLGVVPAPAPTVAPKPADAAKVAPTAPSATPAKPAAPAAPVAAPKPAAVVPIPSPAPAAVVPIPSPAPAAIAPLPSPGPEAVVPIPSPAPAK